MKNLVNYFTSHDMGDTATLEAASKELSAMVEAFVSFVQQNYGWLIPLMLIGTVLAFILTLGGSIASRVIRVLVSVVIAGAAVGLVVYLTGALG